jgi:hyperosmotically inducible protein
MYARTLIGVAALLFLSGCNDSMKKPNVGTSNNPASAGAAADRATTKASSRSSNNADDRDPTNTGRNERDRNGNNPTADNQSESRNDLEVTAEIRRAITEDSSLSVNAHNVKIISENGSVFLRGPVDSEEEKSTIVDEARRVAGETKVVDELEVKESAK